ncbi:MAG: hypothetical protein H6711_01940 [Myxococcales bacterium]|nr:hypothetical protein [Myxococcales bacterium]
MRRLLGIRELSLGLSLAGLLGGALVGAPQVAEAHRPRVEPIYEAPPAVGRDVSVSIESPYGGSLASYWHGGSMFVEGRIGERYNIRLQNNSGERIEAVVTVDGRDVVSGDVGDYRKQRGYVIEPYGSVVIEGYRQSLDYVAAFRFSDIHGSYSALRGTPQHVGVIGVAVFKEAGRRTRPRPTPITRNNRYAPEYEPYYEPYGGSARGDRGSAPAAAEEAAPASRPGRASSSKSADAAYGYGSGGSSYAPPPARPNQIGTEYGETTYSSVRETSFKRRNARRPDSLTTIYYDSHEGLRARGVPVDPPPTYFAPPPPYAPQPFPEVGYAPPPPRRY